jgi:V8-like Glu-specific endopeptidase
MPINGHVPLASESEPELGLRVITEAFAPSSNRSNRSSLPNYQPPRRRRPDSIRESAAPSGSEEFLPDVAVASFGETSILEVVFGNDDRVRVADNLLRANPWRQICALRILSKTGKTYVGTGWFIAPRVLATAGHCVYLQNEGGWAQSIDVIPALRGEQEPYGRTRSTRFRAVDGWVKGQARDFDYAAIVLNDASLGTRLGNFAVNPLDDAALKGAHAKISGYPADRDRATFQYFHERPLQPSTQTRLNYDIDTFGGQSGSPIWVDTEQSGLVAVGIHTTGSATGNSGTRINANVLGNLVSWIEEA